MNEARTRTLLIVGAIVLAVLSIAGGAMIAMSGDERAAESPIPTSGSTPTPTETPTPAPSEASSPTPTTSPTGSPVLADGRHFVYVTDAARLEDGSATVTFNLAEFYRGERAEAEAAERGDEVVNDYYIVNENPRLRTIPLADTVTVRYIPVDRCCELHDGNLDAWLESIIETNPTHYPGKDGAWWFRVDAGLVTRIEQQFLP